MNFHLNIVDREEFSYPNSFIQTISSNPEIDIEPWWFIFFGEGDVNYWHHTLKKLYPKRDLIPFARFNANDDIACFDGNDTSGDPKVVIIHAYASDGWELHGSYENFYAWLDAAIDTHNSWEEDE
ncbi:hypothetical protein [Pseudomonas sp. TWP3-2]|uniref:hypothetical protein n=1 Tax=Pseudomonas sp. TWP3-2 TaxID=2804574 RepID=UPI003CF2D0D6